MNIQEEMYINGFYEGIFKDDESLSNLDFAISEITNGNLKKGFSLEEKYNASLDLRPNVLSYDDVFMDVIIDNKIHEMINKATGVDLCLAHIQLRVSYPSPKGSYVSWHRDTHQYNKSDIIGNIPPAYKLIYYPSLGHKKTDQMGIIAKSHNFIFNSKLLDMTYARLVKPKIISSSRGQFVFLNTALLHRAINPEQQKGSARLIYSFVRNEQLAGYDEEVFKRFKKLI
jgi:hypothetical protein